MLLILACPADDTQVLGMSPVMHVCTYSQAKQHTPGLGGELFIPCHAADGGQQGRRPA